MVDSVIEIITERGSQKFYKPIEAHSVTNTIGKIDVSMIFVVDVSRFLLLDITKAFDKFWHEGIIFKLQQNGISDDILNILSDFLRDRKSYV